MSRVRPPDDIEIAALRKKQRTVFDPMTAGVGTPWEDRGTHGTVGAFFKTCLMSLTAPGKLMNAIRRPETINDARAFLFGICGIWAISAIGHYVYFVWNAFKTPLPGYSIDLNTTVTEVLGVLTLLGAGLGCYFLFKVYTGIYGRLVAQEKDSVLLPEPLIFNVNAYALGPSLLALIPFAGPVIALLWIFVDLIVAGNSRFRIKLSGAVIDALLSYLAVLGIVVVVLVIGEFVLLHKVAGYDPVVFIKIPDRTTP
jgi:hypothetical protein